MGATQRLRLAIMSSQPDDTTTGTTPNETSFGSPAGAIFNMYTTRAQKLDQESVEIWKEGANTILIFVRFHTARR